MIRIRAFIPEKVNSRIIIGFLELLRFFQINNKKRNNANYAANISVYPDNCVQAVYIENQGDFSQLKFGKYDVKYSGCEILAVYNALIALKGAENTPPLPVLIRDFEKDGMLLSGKFGTSPKALVKYLMHQEIKCQFSTKRDEMLRICNNSECLILTYFNDRRDIFEQVHSICVTKNEQGYVAHNAGHSGKPTVPFKSVEKLIDTIGYGYIRVISVIGMEK